MDYISSFDIRLSKDVYYAGETVAGSVLLENTENIKVKGRLESVCRDFVFRVYFHRDFSVVL